MLKKIIGLSIVGLVLIGLSGCAKYKPFDINSKYTTTKKGYQYRIPYSVRGSIVGSESYTNSVIDGMLELKSKTCDYGDYLWITNKNGVVAKPKNWESNPYMKAVTPEGYTKYAAWDFLNSKKQGLAGCTAPINGNPNALTIIFLEGNPYKVPGLSLHKNRVVSAKEFQGLNKMGYTNCKKKSVIWLMPTSYKLTGETVVKLFKQGRAKCTNPLSDREYNYLMNKNNSNNQFRQQVNQNEQRRQFEREQQQKEFEQEQKIQSQKSLNKTLDRINDSSNANTPINVNVHHYDY